MKTDIADIILYGPYKIKNVELIKDGISNGTVKKLELFIDGKVTVTSEYAKPKYKKCFVDEEERKVWLEDEIS